MALGDNYNNNKNKYNPTVYSKYGMSNKDSKVDQTSLSSSFWNGMLKLSISPKLETNGDIVKFDHKNSISIYLNHTKARMLYIEITKFLKNSEQFNNVGVQSGASGLISLSNGKEFGISNPVLIIRKINPDNGSVDASFAYEFKQNYHYSIRNFEESNASFDKVYYNDLELDQLLSLLKTYYEAMTGAVAYTVIDNMKYDVSRLNTKIGSVMDKLGIERTRNNNYNSTSIFDTKEPRNFSSSTIDELENSLE